MADPTKLAEQFGSVARGQYEASGSVAPVVMLLDVAGHGLALVGPVDAHPTDSLPMIVGVCHPAIPGFRYVATVVEAWVKEFPEHEDTEDFQRGDLEKAHDAGDEQVFTALIVMVLDVQLRQRSCLITSKNIGTTENPIWDTWTMSGYPEGLLSDRCWDMASQQPESPPPPVGLDAWALLAVRLGLASQATPI